MKRLIIRILRALRIRNPSPETFLIPAYAGLGNFIMMTPMILELKRRIPGARIFLLSWPSYGTDQVFDAPVVDGGEQRERIQESEWRKSGGKGVRREDLGGRVCLARSGSFCCAPSVPDAPSLQSSILNSESSRLSAVSGVFLLDPALPMWRKALFFLKLRQWRFAAAFIPFDACPAFVWWGFAMAGCCSVAGHTMETMGIRMGWAKSVLDISTPVNVGSHESDIHFDLLDAWDREEKRKGKTGERSYATHVASGGVEVIGKFGLCDRGYIAVQLSAANARIKTPKLWDRGKFAEVISRLAADGETIVLPGDENEKPLVDDFVRDHGLHHVVNIAGKTTVREISTVIKHAKLLLVHDSGLMHIGNAHGTPLLALYGPTDWNFTEPKAATSHILRKNLPCQPCMAKMAKDETQAMNGCPIQVQCMRDITVDEVYEACRMLLCSG